MTVAGPAGLDLPVQDQSSSPVSQRPSAWQQLQREALHKHFVSLCWPRDVRCWREADGGDLRGFGEPRLIFPTGVAEEKEEEKNVKTLSDASHI